jgi:ferredoxin
MPTVTIAQSSLGPAVSAEVDLPERLLDLCDRLRAPIAFSCRSATCGTCLVEVLEGAALLDRPGPDEREVLSLFEATPSQRLACQAQIQAGSGLVRLAWVDPEAEPPQREPANSLPG